MGKNFTKKLLPLALTAAMIVPSVPAMAAPSDIAGHWAESVITQWQSKGLIQGYEDGTFKPGNTITRAEFVTLMNNAKGFWSEGSINFSDVKNGSWFYSAVARAVAAGYVKGYSDGSFKPGNTITRAEVTTIVNRMLDRSADEAYVDRHADELEQFTDVPDTHWAYYEVAEATNAHDYDRTSGSEDWTQLW